MEEVTIKSIHEDLIELKKELKLVISILISEGKLSKWAVNEIIKARKESESEYTSLEDL